MSHENDLGSDDRTPRHAAESDTTNLSTPSHTTPAHAEPTHTEGKYLVANGKDDETAPPTSADTTAVRAVDSTDSSTTASSTPQAPSAGASLTSKRKATPLFGLIIGLPIVVALMLLAFAAPAVHSGAKDLPIAVSGPSAATAKVQSMLEQKKPGAFDVTTYADAGQGAKAIKDRDAVGGIALTKDGATIQTASGAGSPYAPILKSIGADLAEQGQKVTYTDVAPLPAKDSTGAAMTAAGLPLIFGGMGTAAAMFLGFRGSFGHRVIGVLGVGVFAGAVAAAILHFWLDVSTGTYWHLWAAFTMGIMAISFTVLGLAKNLGPAGFGLGAVIMLFIANPISGMATGPQWLPHPWGSIGQYLPVGAAGTALRSAMYFDGRGATHAFVVLACWAIGGAALLAVGKARKTAH